MKDLQIRTRNVVELTPELQKSSSRQTHRRLCRHKNELVLVDPKPYVRPDDPEGDGAFENANDIVQLLQNHGPEELGTLRCKAFYEDEHKKQIYFVFSLPPGCNEHSPFSTLYDLLEEMKPSATARLALAQFLAKSLLRMHELGFYHKGMRSDSVIFFRRSPNDGRSINKPYLAGFDISRKANPEKYSEKILEADRNVYRHPNALSDPDTEFEEKFDYYSLGIVFVEIALWRRISQVLGAYFQNEYISSTEIWKIKDILLGEDPQAHDHPLEIAFHMGDRYLDVVKLCLSSMFGRNVTDAALREEFKLRVVQVLERCAV